MNNPAPLPGQSLRIQLCPSDFWQVDFNTEAKILHKEFSKGPLHLESQLGYSMKFERVSQAGQKVLKDLFQK